MEFIMGNVNVVLLVVAIVASILAACALVVALKKRGVDVPAALEVASLGLDGADQITDILKSLFPASGVVNIVDKIIDYAKTGVKKAEQLYKINQISKYERKEEATRFVYEALELAGIEVTPAIAKIIDGSIEAAVGTIGHAPDTSDNGEGCGQ